MGTVITTFLSLIVIFLGLVVYVLWRLYQAIDDLAWEIHDAHKVEGACSECLEKA